MSGIKELSEIMRNLNPILSEEDYVFCSFHNLTAGDLKEVEPFGMIQEAEGRGGYRVRQVRQLTYFSFNRHNDMCL